MSFTPLKDAITARRGAVMDQVYANYEAELNTDRAMAFLSNPKSNDPYITFPAYGLDAEYIDQVINEMTEAGWKRVSVNKKVGAPDVWDVKAYRDDVKTAQAPAPKPQEPETPADSDTGDTTETPPAEPVDEPAAEPSAPTETDSGTADSEPVQPEPADETPASDAPAQEPATDTDASEEPAAEPAPASDSTADSTTEPAPTERQNPLLTPKS